MKTENSGKAYLFPAAAMIKTYAPAQTVRERTFFGNLSQIIYGGGRFQSTERTDIEGIEKDGGTEKDEIRGGLRKIKLPVDKCTEFMI